jgi:hypothetical protein
MTESVYVIEGTQTDGKGSYPTGSVYFNPPGSGHQISDSSGFFLLAYASPPDFMATDMIGEYEPLRIDTTASDLTTDYPFQEQDGGANVYTVPLDESGGLNAVMIELSDTDVYSYTGKLRARAVWQLRDWRRALWRGNAGGDESDRDHQVRPRRNRR